MQDFLEKVDTIHFEILQKKLVLTKFWSYDRDCGSKESHIHVNYFSVLSSAILLAQYSALSLVKEYFYVSLILGIVECVIAFFLEN